MKPMFAVLAMLLVPECGVFSPAVHSTTGAVGGGDGQDGGAPYAVGGGDGQDGGAPYLSIYFRTYTPILIQADAGWRPLPWDGGELPLLDSGITQWNYEIPHCDLERLRTRTTETPGVGLGIDAPSAELQAAAMLMVGEWTGTRTTRWDDTHPLTIIFFESGRYSIATGDCASPTYYGALCSDHFLSWRLDTGTSVQAEGELMLEYMVTGGPGTTWMKHVRVSQSTLSFDLWHREYGPIHYELERVLETPCAGRSLVTCP